MPHSFRSRLFFGLILLIGAIFRFVGLNWDSGYMLHPDERFLVMVMQAMTIPESFARYLDPTLSTMNPMLIGHEFYVYGIAPLVLTKIIAVLTENDTYNQLAIVGRSLAATADLLTLIVVYQCGRLFEQHRRFPEGTALFAMGCYAVAVLPIQLAHFFAVDPFLLLSVWLGIYLGLRAVYSGQWWLFLGAGVCFGLALASKASAVYSAPVFAGLILLMAVGRYWRQHLHHYPHTVHFHWPRHWQPYARVIGETFGVGLIFGVVALVALRIGSPHYFSGEWTFPGLNEQWLNNIEQLELLSSPEAWFPPSVQWISTQPVIFPLLNMMLYGLGGFLFVTAIVGLVVLVVRHLRDLEVMLLVIWGLGFFAYQSVQFVTALRYFLLLYPLLAIAAGYALASLAHLPDTSRRLRVGLIGTLGVTILVWPLMMMNIYLNPHSRVEASYWIHANLEDGSLILSEHWDDGLPLHIPEARKQFVGEQLEVFGMDTDEKFARMEEQMQRADYYILSSNRAWGSIPRVPERYPRMTRFYEELFAEELGYELVAEFTRYPSLSWMGIPLTIPDDTADETFTVYDHPKVLIFRRTGAPVELPE